MIIFPSSGIQIDNKPSITSNRNNILYVGGNGSGNYTKIQGAIDDASDGDTVFVYDDSSPYYEYLNIRKHISVIGEDKNTTIIDANRYGIAVRISNDNGVFLSGFTIRNSAICIAIEGSNHNIIGNIIISGLTNYSSDNIYAVGIDIIGSNNNIIGNVIYRAENNNPIIMSFGIIVEEGDYYTIKGNSINNTKGVGANGILVCGSSYTNITGNSICNTDGGAGIDIEWCKNIKITKNNIINKKNANFYNPLKNIKTTNWDENYWYKPVDKPYRIWGKCHIKTIFPGPFPLIPYDISIPWFQYDKNPAQEPFDIPGPKYFKDCGIK
jgi:hypothetical protein